MGTEKKVYAIGKPRCFKKARPPLPYYNSVNAWIWSDILQKFDRYFKSVAYAQTSLVSRFARYDLKLFSKSRFFGQRHGQNAEGFGCVEIW